MKFCTLEVKKEDFKSKCLCWTKMPMISDGHYVQEILNFVHGTYKHIQSVLFTLIENLPGAWKVSV